MEFGTPIRHAEGVCVVKIALPAASHEIWALSSFTQCPIPYSRTTFFFSEVVSFLSKLKFHRRGRIPGG